MKKPVKTTRSIFEVRGDVETLEKIRTQAAQRGLDHKGTRQVGTSHVQVRLDGPHHEVAVMKKQLLDI